MPPERTCVLLKPDCLERGIVGEILSRIENRGFAITGMKLMRLDEHIISEHYAHIVGMPYYADTAKYMTSGPVIALILEKQNAIAEMRSLIGADLKGPETGTIRGDFAQSKTKNTIHASDSPQTAAVEIARFFGE
jgi:nucleoside-diphosphate kinase